MPASSLRRLILGNPIPTQEAQHHRLPKFLALPVFSSDAISSSAYATEEILIVLNRYLVPLMGGAVALGYSVPVAIGIATLLLIVTISYQQTVRAYPGGGGAYIVARDNLGEAAAQIAGAALLTDYVLTVSVSTAAGVAAIDSAFPTLLPHRVGICLLCIAFMTIVNLRGVKESGWVAAAPAYLFIGCMLTLIGLGFLHVLRSGLPPAPASLPAPTSGMPPLSTFAFVFILMHAFANGCSALTGVEAISNGVTAFRAPEARNASITMIWMSGILAVLFLGLTALARIFHIVPVPHETVVSQVGRIVFMTGPLYYLLQAATAAILIMAANTAYADFPRLASLHAGDGFLPRQLTQLGDRLVFQNGIIVLGAVAATLIVAFHGTVDRLIPLYAIGVFLSFTMSQTGMVRRWFRLRGPQWRVKAVINGLGAVCCAVVMVVFAVTKFREGAWIVIVMVPLMVTIFFRIHYHYRDVAQQLSLGNASPTITPLRHKVLVPISGVHRGVLTALDYASSLGGDVEAVYIEVTPGAADAVRERWDQWGHGIPLKVIHSQWRQLHQPLLDYIDRVIVEENLDLVTVILPEFILGKWWHNFLHNQSGIQLSLALRQKPKVVVTHIRHQLR